MESLGVLPIDWSFYLPMVLRREAKTFWNLEMARFARDNLDHWHGTKHLGSNQRVLPLCSLLAVLPLEMTTTVDQ